MRLGPSELIIILVIVMIMFGPQIFYAIGSFGQYGADDDYEEEEKPKPAPKKAPEKAAAKKSSSAKKNAAAPGSGAGVRIFQLVALILIFAFFFAYQNGWLEKFMGA